MAFQVQVLEAVDSFVQAMNVKHQPNREGANTAFGYVFQAEVLRRYVRITQHMLTPEGEVVSYSGSVHAFVNQEGDILKPAGWAKPAPGARGNLLLEGSETVAARADFAGSYLYLDAVKARVAATI